MQISVLRPFGRAKGVAVRFLPFGSAKGVAVLRFMAV